MSQSKTLPLSRIIELMEAQGYYLEMVTADHFTFRNERRGTHVKRSSDNPHRIRLRDLIQQFPDLKRQFIQLADAEEQPRKSPFPIQADVVMKKILANPHLPSQGTTAFKLLQVIYDDAPNYQRMVDLIQEDPAIAAKIIQHANSPLYPRAARTTSVLEAAKYLGTRRITEIALSASIINSKGGRFCPEFDYNEYWAHSLAKATAAQDFIELTDCKILPAGVSYTAGLLSKIGQLALATVFPKDYSVIFRENRRNVQDLLTEEKKHFGLHHNEITACLMKHWHLPDYFAQAVQFQDERKFDNIFSKKTRAFHLAVMLRFATYITNVMYNQGKGFPRPRLDKLVSVAHQIQRQWLEDADLRTHKYDRITFDFPEYFNRVGAHWNEIGELFNISIRKAPRWNDVYQQSGSN